MKRKKIVNRILTPVLAITMALLLVGSFLPSTVFAVDTDGSDDEGGSGSEVNIDEMQAELNQVEQDKNEAQAEMNAIASRIEEKEREVERINNEVELKQDEIKRKQEEIEAQANMIKEQQHSIEEQYEGLNNRLRTMYKNGSIGFLDVLLGSASFSELMTNLDMVQLIYKSDKETLENLHEHYDKLKDALDELNDMQNQLHKAKDDLLEEKNNAVVAQGELNDALTIAHERVEAFEEIARNLAGQIYAEQLKAEAELERIRAENKRKAEEEAKRKAEEDAKREAEEEAANKAKIEELDAEIERLQTAIADKQAEVDQITIARDAKQAEIDALFGEEFTANKADLQAQLENLEAELAAIEAEANAEGFEASEEYDARLNAKKEEIEYIKAQIEELMPDTSSLELEKQELENALATLQDELDDLEAQLLASQEEKDSLSKPSESSVVVAHEEYTGGKLAWPINNVVITSGFGLRDLGAYSDHKGLDMYDAAYGSSAGAPIYAPASGMVIAPTGPLEGYGIGLFIAHGSGVVTEYAHLSGLAVSVGDYVNKGQLIAYMGETGWAMGVHLHFSVMINGVPQDPLLYLE